MVILAYSEGPICSSSCESKNRCKGFLKPNFMLLFPISTLSCCMTSVLLCNWGQGVCVCLCLHPSMYELQIVFHGVKNRELLWLPGNEEKATIFDSFPWPSAALWTSLFNTVLKKKKKGSISLKTMFILWPREGIINSSVSGRSKL